MKVDRASLRMSDGEVEAYLSERRWARLATVSTEGEPHVSPVGYIYLAGLVYVYSATSSPRTRNVRAGSRVSLCVDDGTGEGEGYRDRRGAIVTGSATELADDDPSLERVRPAYSAALFGDASVEVSRRTHVWLRIEPHRIASWDFGRIPPGADRFA